MYLKTFQEFFTGDNLFIQIQLTGPVKGYAYRRAELRPFEAKETQAYQMTLYDSKKAYHTNLSLNEAEKTFRDLFEKSFTNAMVFTTEADFHYSKVGKKIRRKQLPTSKQPCCDGHNKVKNTVFNTGTHYPFLSELGITNTDGMPHKGWGDKFIQINKFLEIFKASDPKTENMSVVDMGCGKAYLTFALYHYLAVMEKRMVKIIGVDNNKDLMIQCNALAQKLGYTHLHFVESAIEAYQIDNIDVVISLHACNTATDDTLVKAINAKAKLILSAPCCQQEFYPKIKSQPLNQMLHYGLVKERVAALATDTYRCLTLNTQGYKTQMIEFVDHGHTLKNILLKAVFTGKKTNQSEREAFKTFWGLNDLYLDKKLGD
ncbi:MAG: SAM-dependent methyltransferase [Alphaproteobacteria bacterium]|nr:SAM-dependent methyltransferase [Alphaproteobacteria bacterium]MBN2779628.1 SAM-dependent methyltransferase [Alphaproteobacteria bacterium]